MNRTSPFPQLTTHAFVFLFSFSFRVTTNPIPFLIEKLMYILRRDPASTTRHSRRQAAVSCAGKNAAEPLDRLVVSLKDDLRAVLVLLIVPVLNRVRVEVGALRDGLKQLGCLGLGWCRCVGCGGVRRDWGCARRFGEGNQGEFNRFELVVTGAALGKFKL
jgi:hypothetical protein